MLHYLTIPFRVTLLSIVLLALPATTFAQGIPPGQLDTSKDPLKWRVERLSKEPFKLIKATPDPEHGQVRFVIEFTRAPSLTELYDWERIGAPVVFRFLDEDGVVLRSVVPKLDGEIVRKEGTRIRLLLPLPDEKILALTRSVAAN
jgi:hypothetical protein